MIICVNVVLSFSSGSKGFGIFGELKCALFYSAIVAVARYNFNVVRFFVKLFSITCYLIRNYLSNRVNCYGYY